MEDSAVAPGFKSAKARKKFFIVTGLAAVAVMVLEVLLGILPLSNAPAPSEARWATRLANVHAASAAFWKDPSQSSSESHGDLWYTASEVSSGLEAPQTFENNRLIHVTAQGPTKVLGLASGPAWLLAQGGTLWIFASDGISKYDGKTAAQVPAKQLTEFESPPFLFGGLPATVHEQGGERRVLALENGAWVEKAQLFFGDAKDLPPADRIRALEAGGRLYVFCLQADVLYCHDGLPAKEAHFPADWEAVGPGSELWAVAANEGKPEVFTVKMAKDRPIAEIVGFLRDGGAESAPGHSESAGVAKASPTSQPVTLWKPAFSRLSPLPLHTLGAATDSADGCCVVYQALQLLWTVNVVQLEGDKVVSAKRYGEITPAERSRLWLEVIRWAASAALSIALAVALARWMKIYRTDGFLLPGPSTGGSGQVPSTSGFGHAPSAAPPVPNIHLTQPASLTRRALALLIDAVLVFGPLIAGMMGMLWIMPGIEDHPERGLWVAYLYMLLIGGGLWAFAAFLFFSHRLGRTGRTPGKWTMGIRVIGTNLAPCGFWRALLRSLLLIVDGLLFMDAFVNFCFGALIIACTLNRQRIGDIVARTIVVRE